MMMYTQLIQRLVLAVDTAQPSIAIPAAIQARAYRYHGKVKGKAAARYDLTMLPNNSGADCRFGLDGSHGSLTSGNANEGLKMADASAPVDYMNASFSLDNEEGLGGRLFICQFATHNAPPVIVSHGTFRGSCTVSGAISSLAFGTNGGGTGLLAGTVIELWADVRGGLYT